MGERQSERSRVTKGVKDFNAEDRLEPSALLLEGGRYLSIGLAYSTTCWGTVVVGCLSLSKIVTLVRGEPFHCLP